MIDCYRELLTFGSNLQSGVKVSEKKKIDRNSVSKPNFPKSTWG